MFLEQLKCESLVALHESAVADHVREHDRSEFAMFDCLRSHFDSDFFQKDGESQVALRALLYTLVVVREESDGVAAFVHHAAAASAAHK